MDHDIKEENLIVIPQQGVLTEKEIELYFGSMYEKEIDEMIEENIDELIEEDVL